MIKHINSTDMGSNETDVDSGLYHFSVKAYHNPNNINFGKLRIFNDIKLKPMKGYDLHAERNLEIISYVIDGEISYFDSLNNLLVLKVGDLQYVSSGKGIYHSEKNNTQKDSRYIQIGVLPSIRNLNPTSSYLNIDNIVLSNEWTKVAGALDAPIIVNQDINIYILKLDKQHTSSFQVEVDRQAYLVQIDGKSSINGFELSPRDALKIWEENIQIKAFDYSHFIIVEMKKG